MRTETTKVRLNGALLPPEIVPLAWQNCQQCGAVSASGQCVCATCQTATKTDASVCARPAIWRRLLAGTIDRLVTLPFLAFFFPRWTLVVLAYHLLCDCSPERRSLGKWVCRLRVVKVVGGPRVEWWQAVLRRVGAAVVQTAWCLWEFIPWVLVYELAALACVLLDAQGRRPEDFLAGTRVVTEKTFRQIQKMEKQTKENSYA